MLHQRYRHCRRSDLRDTTTNHWSNSAHWSTAPFFPNNGNGGFTYDVFVNGGTVTLDLDVAIQALIFTGGTLMSAPAAFTEELHKRGVSIKG